ncbi:MAG: hypothetical protein ABI988_07445 [Nitrospirota bacterium]
MSLSTVMDRGPRAPFQSPIEDPDDHLIQHPNTGLQRKAVGISVTHDRQD